jgi:hypothetical protein
VRPSRREADVGRVLRTEVGRVVVRRETATWRWWCRAVRPPTVSSLRALPVPTR